MEYLLKKCDLSWFSLQILQLLLNSEILKYLIWLRWNSQDLARSTVPLT